MCVCVYHTLRCMHIQWNPFKEATLMRGHLWKGHLTM